MVKAKNINVHIERLILHGFDPRDRQGVGEAVKLELTRLLAGQKLPPMLSRGGDIAQLKGEAFHKSPNSKATVVGNQIAQSIHSGFVK